MALDSLMDTALCLYSGEFPVTGCCDNHAHHITMPTTKPIQHVGPIIVCACMGNLLETNTQSEISGQGQQILNMMLSSKNDALAPCIM